VSEWLKKNDSCPICRTKKPENDPKDTHDNNNDDKNNNNNNNNNVYRPSSLNIDDITYLQSRRDFYRQVDYDTYSSPRRSDFNCCDSSSSDSGYGGGSCDGGGGSSGSW
jgi:uncharacterized membrane protein YgcG